MEENNEGITNKITQETPKEVVTPKSRTPRAPRKVAAPKTAVATKPAAATRAPRAPRPSRAVAKPTIEIPVVEETPEVIITEETIIIVEGKTKKVKNYHSEYTIRCITEDENKNLWIGTVEGGLLLFNRKTGTFKKYTTQNGLSSNTILRLLKDKKGDLWMSTYQGISRLNPKNNTFRSFGVSDVLSGK